MKRCTLFLLLALVVAVSVSVFTANATTESATDTFDNSSISAKFAEGTTMAVCPKCGGDPVEWKSINGITKNAELTAGGHYYLTDTYKQYLSVSGEKEVCIHLNGYDWDQSVKSRALYMSGTDACIVNIMGEGTVCGSDGYTDRTTRGATIEVNGSGAVLNLLGGTYTKHVSTSVGSGSMEISGPTVALYTGGGTINMYAGATITGENTVGNTVRVPTGTFHMYGGTITDGTGAQGGNVLVTYNSTKAAGTFIMEDGLISNGTAAGYGGNIRVEGGGTAGDADAPHAVFEMLGGTISGGAAKSNGGNIYATTNSVVTICGTVKDNISAAVGGNISTAGQAQVTLRNATISGGVADSKGQNVHQAGGADFTIEGNVQVIGGNWWNTQSQCVINVAKDFSGVAKLYFEDGHLEDPVYGTAIKAATCDGAFSGKLYLDGGYDYPEIYGTEDGKLFVSAIAVNDGESYVWYIDAASAVAACDEGSYVKMLVAQDVVLTKDCAIDLCGHVINISGTYTLYGMDSSGDDYSNPTGKAIVSEETKLASYTSVAGKSYVSTTESNEAVFYHLGNRISGVALRPSADGIYYTGSFGCNETVLSNVASYGVAVSLVNAPGADFMTDEDTLYTGFAGNTLEGGVNATGALIAGIMKQENNAQLNSAYGQMPIFAVAYLEMKDGTVIISDSVALSLQDVMESVDELIVSDPLNYRKLTNPMRAFYEKWADNGMADWNFKKIATPEEDDVIDILMIGNSFCYYYVEELVGLAAADGVKIRVCNVYYSGCKLYQHYNWWIAGDAPYEFFDTTFEGGRKKTANVSLEWCLAQGEWDYISMQTIESSGVSGDPAQAVEKNKLYLDTFTSYLREQFPKAQMVWHQTWAYAVGTATNGIVTTPESQVTSHEKNSKIAEIISETYDMINVNTGDAWKIIRDSGYDKLCGRIGYGTNHEGDYYHDGDIGGGQYLNACVWYEIITGNSVIGNTYRPVYTYNGTEIPLNSEITYEMLQEAAHEAVAAFHSK